MSWIESADAITIASGRLEHAVPSSNSLTSGRSTGRSEASLPSSVTAEVSSSHVSAPILYSSLIASWTRAAGGGVRDCSRRAEGAPNCSSKILILSTVLSSGTRKISATSKGSMATS
eukprot:768764-Hanusia_phi.AAC.1